MDKHWGVSTEILQTWESTLKEKISKLNLEDRKKGEIGGNLRHLLNYLDEMGFMLKQNWIDKEFLSGSRRSVIREILRESADLVQTDIDNPDRGRIWWANVLFVAEQREIDVDVWDEAKRLRSKWALPSNFEP